MHSSCDARSLQGEDRSQKSNPRYRAVQVGDLTDYAEKYLPRFRLERTDEGVLFVRWKPWEPDELRTVTSVLLSWPPPLQMAEPLWRDISSDEANKIVILTGTGENFYSMERGARGGRYTADIWTKVLLGVTRSIDAFLDIPTILIGAANGAATLHAEYLLMCDLVVASEDAFFEDRAHYSNDMAPGDGVNVIWPLLLGLNRGRDFLLTGRSISAHEALDLGLVRDVVPRHRLQQHCLDLAQQLLEAGDVARRLTAIAIRRSLKMQMMEQLAHSMALEGLIFIDRNRELHHAPSAAGDEPEGPG